MKSIGEGKQLIATTYMVEFLFKSPPTILEVGSDMVAKRRLLFFSTAIRGHQNRTRKEREGREKIQGLAPDKTESLESINAPKSLATNL